MKPEIEKNEKQARRKRWEQVVELAERREQEIRSGRKGRVDGKWVEDKEEAGERAREAAKAAMASGTYQENLTAPKEGSGSLNEESVDLTSEGSRKEEMPYAGPIKNMSAPQASAVKRIPLSRTYYGFDEDDDFMSEDSEEGKEAVGGRKVQNNPVAA